MTQGPVGQPPDTTLEAPHDVRRLCAAVGVPDGTDDVLPLLRDACAVPGLDRVLWEATSEGGVLGVWPPGIDEPAALATFLGRLRDLLAAHNAAARQGPAEVSGPVSGRAEVSGPVSRPADVSGSVSGRADVSAPADVSERADGPGPTGHSGPEADSGPADVSWAAVPSEPADHSAPAAPPGPAAGPSAHPATPDHRARTPGGAPHRLRLRIAVAEGLTRLGESGFGGRAVVAVRRACSGAWLESRLAARPDTDLVVVAAEPLAHDLSVSRTDVSTADVHDSTADVHAFPADAPVSTTGAPRPTASGTAPGATVSRADAAPGPAVSRTDTAHNPTASRPDALPADPHRADGSAPPRHGSFTDGRWTWCELFDTRGPNPVLARGPLPPAPVETRPTAERSPAMRIAFLGKCGAGKSSLINALFGLDLETGRFQATTLDLHHVPAVLRTAGHGALPVDVVDTPGYAESQETEEAYRDLYTALLPRLDHAVWVVQAHPRAFRPDQEALRALAHTLGPHTGVTVAITRADTIGPGDWDHAARRPSPGQRLALTQQVGNVYGKLAPYLPALTEGDIIPCSTTEQYGLDTLTEHIRVGLMAASTTER
ncbi:GTPase [Streptomyces sp. NPDC002055]|uniref:GTPase n=1 Tax=Streptomyces sp. NPDC002055 TaxID=3154534 RepID=UPI00332ECCF5